jgi:hypothetical protein
MGMVILTNIALRFSSVGRLVAIWGNAPDFHLEALEPRLVSLLETSSYLPVPLAALEHLYTGGNQQAGHVESLRLRLCDYS